MLTPVMVGCNLGSEEQRALGLDDFLARLPKETLESWTRVCFEVLLSVLMVVNKGSHFAVADVEAIQWSR